jgi:hypothetical protein
MKIEVCDICNQPVDETHKTVCIFKDWNGVSIDHGGFCSARRKWKGVICDKCLSKIRRERNGE